MFLNASVIAAAACALAQAGLAGVVSVTAVRSIRARTNARSAAQHDSAEIERMRPALPALALLVVVGLSYPLLISVLASHVGEWPGAMCIEGISRIGEGSRSAARFLPHLLDALLIAKPVAIALAGLWAVVHLVERRAAGRPSSLGPAVLLAVGLLCTLDGLVEVAYLAIPKQDDVVSTGCCLATPVALRSAGSSWLEGWWPDLAPGHAAALLGLSVAALALALGLVLRRRRAGGAPGAGSWAAVIAAAAATGLLAQHAVIAIASPALHGVPAHRCLWCVLEYAPSSAVPIATLWVALTLAVLAAFAARLERLRGTSDRAASSGLARAALVLLALALATLVLIAVAAMVFRSQQTLTGG